MRVCRILTEQDLETDSGRGDRKAVGGMQYRTSEWAECIEYNRIHRFRSGRAYSPGSKQNLAGGMGKRYGGCTNRDSNLSKHIGRAYQVAATYSSQAGVAICPKQITVPPKMGWAGGPGAWISVASIGE